MSLASTAMKASNKPGARAPRTCGSCFNPITPDMKRCNRCGKAVGSGASRGRALSSVRESCPHCKQVKVLQKLTFGVVPTSGPRNLTELELIACSSCLGRNEAVRETSQQLVRGAMLTGVLALFSMIQWYASESGGWAYMLAAMFLGSIGTGLWLIARSKVQHAILALVGKHPRVVDLQSKGGIRILTAAELEKLA